MNQKAKTILVIVILVLLIGTGMTLSYISNRISPIPSDTIGNSAGNLRGKGLFCEYNGKVYFSNAYDNGALYVMNPDCTEMKRLANTSASYINAGGNYLFYYTTMSLPLSLLSCRNPLDVQL